MPSRLLNGRTHLDEATLAHCPDQQTIPFLKLHLAPRVNNKIFRPQKAAYMFQNIPSIPQSQKESLISDFVERSIKSKPLDVKPEVYGPYSSNTTRPNVIKDLTDALTEAVSSPETGTDRDNADAVLFIEENDNSQDDAPNEADDDSPHPPVGEREGQEIGRQGRNILFQRENETTPVSTSLLHSRIVGFGSSPAGSGRSAASASRSTSHFADPIATIGTSAGARQNFVTGDVFTSPMQGQPDNTGRGRMPMMY